MPHFHADPAEKVGKSSLLLQYTDNLFLPPEDTSATIGVDYKSRLIERDGKQYKLNSGRFERAARCLKLGLTEFSLLTSSFSVGQCRCVEFEPTSTL